VLLPNFTDHFLPRISPGCAPVHGRTDVDAVYCVVCLDRSTKGASKQRRDAINERVAQIRELLPVSEAARSRLSQLQVMALAKSYIAKSNLFSTINRQYTYALLTRNTAIFNSAAFGGVLFSLLFVCLFVLLFVSSTG